MTGSSASRPEFTTVPPIERAKPDGLRLDDGTQVAHCNLDLADRFVAAGAAEALCWGLRQYSALGWFKGAVR